MRKAGWGLPLLAAAGLSMLVSTGAGAQTAHEKELYEAAKTEGSVSWSSGILDQPICDQIGAAFMAKYPGIQFSVIKTTSQVAFQRLLQDIKAGQIQSDVFTTTDVGHMLYLKSKDQLVQYVPEAEAGMVPAVAKVDPDGYYHTGWVGLSAIVYNTAKVKPADVPQDWPDLTNAKWKNQITFGSPNYSGMVGVWTVAMAERYGWDYFDKLNDLNPQIGRSIDDSVTVLNSGERRHRQSGDGAAQRRQGQSAGRGLSLVRHAHGHLALGHYQGHAAPQCGQAVHGVHDRAGLFEGPGAEFRAIAAHRRAAADRRQIARRHEAVRADTGADRQGTAAEQVEMARHVRHVRQRWTDEPLA
jgi:iron(III) transport system substrate-binding protein